MRMFLIAVAIGFATIASANATTIYNSANGQVSDVKDPVVPLGKHWEGGTAIGRDWATDPSETRSAALMHRMNLKASGYNPKNDLDAYGNMKQQ